MTSAKILFIVGFFSFLHNIINCSAVEDMNINHVKKELGLDISKLQSDNKIVISLENLILHMSTNAEILAKIPKIDENHEVYHTLAFLFSIGHGFATEDETRIYVKINTKKHLLQYLTFINGDQDIDELYSTKFDHTCIKTITRIFDSKNYKNANFSKELHIDLKPLSLIDTIYYNIVIKSGDHCFTIIPKTAEWIIIRFDKNWNIIKKQ